MFFSIPTAPALRVGERPSPERSREFFEFLEEAEKAGEQPYEGVLIVLRTASGRICRYAVKSSDLSAQEETLRSLRESGDTKITLISAMSRPNIHTVVPAYCMRPLLQLDEANKDAVVIYTTYALQRLDGKPDDSLQDYLNER